MKESDPVKYDESGGEVWRVLLDRERLLGQKTCSSPDLFNSLEIPEVLVCLGKVRQ